MSMSTRCRRRARPLLAAVALILLPPLLASCHGFHAVSFGFETVEIHHGHGHYHGHHHHDGHRHHHHHHHHHGHRVWR